MKGRALNQSSQSLVAFTRATFLQRRQLLTKSLIAWASIVALLFLATVQPSAYALEFPMATHIALPDAADLTAGPGAADLTAEPESMVALYSQLQTRVTISSRELALVSFASRQIEMARTSGGAQKVAKEIMASEYGWNVYQFGCLRTLWIYESHWNYKARNKSSGAHGIPQALPAEKMEVIATDWRTNPVTQIRWGLRYIDDRYSTPCKALAKFKSSRYY